MITSVERQGDSVTAIELEFKNAPADEKLWRLEFSDTGIRLISKNDANTVNCAMDVARVGLALTTT